MVSKEIIFGLILVFAVSIGQAQDRKVIPPPDMTQKTHTFLSSELRVDSVFIRNLNGILFDEAGACWMNCDNKWRNFHLDFEKIDSLNYSIQMMFWNIPAKESIGFYKYNEYFYWLDGDIPPTIILAVKSKKRFSYKEHPPFLIIDPPFWFLMYNSQTGDIEVKEKGCY